MVLDTNAVGFQQPLAGGSVRLLVDAHADGQIVLLLPEVVFEEVVARWERGLREAQRQHVETRRTLRRFGVPLDTYAQADPATEAKRLRARLLLRLRQYGVEIAALPSLTHREVLGRALKRQQPFDPQGRDGYRDTLLWETIVEAASSFDRMLLISNDVAAFGDRSQKEVLASHLREEIGWRTQGAADIDWVRSPAAALEALSLGRSALRTVAESVLARQRAVLDAVLWEGTRAVVGTDERFEQWTPSALMGARVDLVCFGPPWDQAAGIEARVFLTYSASDVRVVHARSREDGTLLVLLIARVAADFALWLDAEQQKAASQRPALARALGDGLTGVDENDEHSYYFHGSVDVAVTARVDPSTDTMMLEDDLEITSGVIR